MTKKPTNHSHYSALVGVVHIVINPSVCVSVCISLEPWDQSARNFICRSPVVVTRSSSGGVALSYVLPVSWMRSRLAIVGSITMQGLSIAKYITPHGVARPRWTLMSLNALLVFEIN